MEQEKQKTEEELAAKIMEYARDELMISMRFLDRALFRMPLVAADSVAAFGVDGATMYYNPEYVLHAFKREKNACTRAFLHMILHCIFSHPFQYEKLDRECWDLATDLAVEQSILDLNLKCVELDITALRITAHIFNPHGKFYLQIQSQTVCCFESCPRRTPGMETYMIHSITLHCTHNTCPVTC